MTCKKGGFISCRHNEIRDILAKLLDEVCRDVDIEPALLPLTGENFNKTSNSTNEARLDVSARNFWNRGERAFFDVRVVNPFAQRHKQQKLENNERTTKKKRKLNITQELLTSNMAYLRRSLCRVTEVWDEKESIL